MAIAILMEFPTVTQEQYDEVVRDMDLGGKAYKGGIFHVAGPKEGGGWRIVDVWESQAAFDAFAQALLMPITQKYNVPPPQITIWPVHNTLTQ
jgi:hypothetical protein